MIIRLPYGQDEISVTIPDSAEIEVVEPKRLKPTPNTTDEIYLALRNPIGAPDLKTMLKPHFRVAIIASDVSRDYLDDLVVPILVRECLEAGIAKENITVVVANGTHHEITKEEMIKKYGQWVNNTVKVINHRANDADSLVFLGRSKQGIPITCNKVVAAADFRIGTGGIDLHGLAGYSGGVKIMSVGVAGEDTIAATHNIQMWEHPNNHLGAIEGNIFREFLTEVAEGIGLDYIFNVVQTSEHELVKAFAGHHVQAFNTGVALARQMFEVEIENKADIVVSNPRHPSDCDIHQATKAMTGVFFGPEPVINQGGILFIPARCQDGIGHEGIRKMLTSFADIDEIISHARKVDFVDSGELVGYKVARGMRLADVAMTDCQIEEEVLKSMHFKVFNTLQEGLDKALIRLPDARILIFPYGSITLPVLKKSDTFRISRERHQ
ncbi:MAG TPA: nickel-dependent lactate racemase [Syntrophorhabdaceae bacterium]|nr:nickel-dependent lactate racemase [Syntrophorhabdaceae bacterium]